MPATTNDQARRQFVAELKTLNPDPIKFVEALGVQMQELIDLHKRKMDRIQRAQQSFVTANGPAMEAHVRSELTAAVEE